MPYLKISSPTDQIQLFWRSNLPNDDISHLKASTKQTILLLNPFFLSIDFLDPQFDDPVLSRNYNLFAFDTISLSGRRLSNTWGVERQLLA